MAEDNFASSLALVLGHEGGYVNNPKDPGGETNKGIIKRVYDAYRKNKGLTARSVKKITSVEVADIYRKQYWDAIKGDDLPLGVDYVVFDGAVNSGPSTSAKWLQRAVGAPDDGIIGQRTIQFASQRDAKKLINDVCDKRLAFLKRLTTWGTFGRGWARRVEEVRNTALSMVRGQTDHEETKPLGQNKASPTDIATTSTTGGKAAVVNGLGIMGTTASSVAEQVQPYVELWVYLKYTFIGLTVIGILIATYVAIKKAGDQND